MDVTKENKNGSINVGKKQNASKWLVKYLKLDVKFKYYYALVVIRFALALLPQRGYVHPDEFFQSTEVLAGDVFELEVNKPWEFNQTNPIRSVAFSLITVGIPYKVLKQLSDFTTFWFRIDLIVPYMLLVFPRLAMTGMSLICDFCLWYMCNIYGQNFMPRLMVFSSSYCVLVFASRTFSNTIEMILFAVLLTLVADSMNFSHEVVWREEMVLERYIAAGRNKPVERAKLIRMRSSLPSHTLRHCEAIAIVTVAGIFNRPTFIAFAAPALFSWLQRGMGSKVIGWSHFHLRILVLSLYGILTMVLMILIDSFYYGHLTVAEIISLEATFSKSFVITPINFLVYNSKTSNLAKHGLHPRWLHALINVPLMFHMLGIAALYGTFNVIKLFLARKWVLLPRVQSITALMHASFVVPLLALSIFPHQEPRFLLPLIIPLTFLYSQSMKLFQKKYARKAWYSLNILAVFFFGFLHQGGIWGLVTHLNNSGLARPAPLNSLHLITTHIYPIPQFPLMLPSTAKTIITPGGKKYKATRRVHFHETGVSDELGLDVAEKILKQCERDWKNHRLKCKVFMIYPGALQYRFENELIKYNMTVAGMPAIFFPHLSTEAMPHFKGISCGDSCWNSYYILKKIQEFGLIMSQISKNTSKSTFKLKP